MYGCLQLVIGIVGCAPSNDPIERLITIYDEVIRIAREPAKEGIEKRKQIDEYLKTVKNEMLELNRSIEVELKKTDDGGEYRETFLLRFDRLAERIREMKIVLKEKEITL